MICLRVCSETTYNFEVSNVQWPSEVHEDTVIETFGDVAPEIRDANDTSAKLRSNLLKVEVYFQEFNYETMQERPSYPVSGRRRLKASLVTLNISTVCSNVVVCVLQLNKNLVIIT